MLVSAGSLMLVASVTSIQTPLRPSRKSARSLHSYIKSLPSYFRSGRSPITLPRSISYPLTYQLCVPRKKKPPRKLQQSLHPPQLDTLPLRPLKTIPPPPNPRPQTPRQRTTPPGLRAALPVHLAQRLFAAGLQLRKRKYMVQSLSLLSRNRSWPLLQLCRRKHLWQTYSGKLLGSLGAMYSILSNEVWIGVMSTLPVFILSSKSFRILRYKCDHRREFARDPSNATGVTGIAEFPFNDDHAFMREGIVESNNDDEKDRAKHTFDPLTDSEYSDTDGSTVVIKQERPSSCDKDLAFKHHTSAQPPHQSTQNHSGTVIASIKPIPQTPKQSPTKPPSSLTSSTPTSSPTTHKITLLALTKNKKTTRALHPPRHTSETHKEFTLRIPHRGTQVIDHKV